MRSAPPSGCFAGKTTEMKDRLCRCGIPEKIDRICWFSSVPPTFEPVFFPFPEPEIRPYFSRVNHPARAALFDLHETRDPATVFSPCGAPVFSESFPQPCGKNPVEKRREMAFFLEFYTVSTEFSTGFCHLVFHRSSQKPPFRKRKFLRFSRPAFHQAAPMPRKTNRVSHRAKKTFLPDPVGGASPDFPSKGDVFR